MNPDNLKLILGAAAVLLALAAPKLWEKLKPYWPKVTSLFSPGKEKVDSIDIDSIATPTDVLDHFSEHEVVEYLLSKRKKAKDEEGSLLLVTYGKLIYDRQLKGKK